MRFSALDFMPQPFAWMSIPAGSVTIQSRLGKERLPENYMNYIPPGTSQTFEVGAFDMAKYPLTNAQFARFIDAGGYRERRWWAEAGWQLKEYNRWTAPLFWQHDRWNKPDYPVVGVSWYEAASFSAWLSDRVEETITLPTEQQWQHAAQGGTNRAVAWDVALCDPDEDIRERCNWNEEETRYTIGSATTPVTQYEGKGDSPYGVVDMTGNVWEWCLTEFDTGNNRLDGEKRKITRGGGHILIYSYEINISVTDRLEFQPYDRRNYVGFRCIRTG